LDDYLIEQGKFKVAEIAQEQRMMPPAIPSPSTSASSRSAVALSSAMKSVASTAAAAKPKEKSATHFSASSSSEADEEEVQSVKRVQNVPNGKETSNAEIKKSVGDLFPALTGNLKLKINF
jgi:hypothetical protein